MMTAPIILVWIGENPLPKWALRSFEFARRNNPDRRMILIMNESNGYTDLAPLHVEIVRISKQDVSCISDIFPALFPGDFWLNTSLRFVYLQHYVRQEGISRFFHSELDNLLFDLGALEQRLDSSGKGLFAPKDSPSRAIASLIYCNDVSTLDNVIRLYGSPHCARNDMEALGLFSLLSSGQFFSLPTESYKQVSEEWPVLSPDWCGGLFDAASMGQYCLGIDPIHCRYAPCMNRFVNENSRVDWSDVRISSDGRNLWFQITKETEPQRLYNLHVHSKQLHLIEDLLHGGRIMKRLKFGRSSVVALSHNRILGPTRKYFDRFRNAIVRITNHLVVR